VSQRRDSKVLIKIRRLRQERIAAICSDAVTKADEEQLCFGLFRALFRTLLPTELEGTNGTSFWAVRSCMLAVLEVPLRDVCE
jgi:hypothetical protein